MAWNFLRNIKLASSAARGRRPARAPGLSLRTSTVVT